VRLERGEPRSQGMRVAYRTTDGDVRKD
jgi:hypothetical protein